MLLQLVRCVLESFTKLVFQPSYHFQYKKLYSDLIEQLSTYSYPRCFMYMSVCVYIHTRVYTNTHTQRQIYIFFQVKFFKTILRETVHVRPLFFSPPEFTVFMANRSTNGFDLCLLSWGFYLFSTVRLYNTGQNQDF